MLTAELVKSAVYTLLREKFPESEIYLDMLPAGFVRPSFFLEQMDITTRDINYSTIEEVSKLAVHCFVSLDDYGNSPENDLSLTGDGVRGLFRSGVIYVGDRAVRCTVLSKPYHYRRSRLRARMRGQGTTTTDMLKNMAESFTNGEVEVQELKGQCRIIFWFTSAMGIPPNILDLQEAICEVIPAHVQFAFSYTYDTHSMLQQYTHKQLGMMTHGQARRDTPHQKLQEYTHNQLRLMKQG